MLAPDGRRHRPPVSHPVSAPRRRAGRLGDDHLRPAPVAHDQEPPADEPRRRARAAGGAARRQRSTAAGRCGARQCQTSARRSSTSTWDARRKKSTASSAARRCSATSRWWDACSRQVVAAVARAGDCQDPHRHRSRARECDCRSHASQHSPAYAPSRCTGARARTSTRARRNTKPFASICADAKIPVIANGDIDSAEKACPCSISLARTR